jgi:hypothetical protein
VRPECKSKTTDDIVDMQLDVEEELTNATKSMESNRLDAKPEFKSETTDEAPKVQQCSVFDYGNDLRVSDVEETSKFPKPSMRELTSIQCHGCGGQHTIDGAFCTAIKVHFCSTCRLM